MKQRWFVVFVLAAFTTVGLMPLIAQAAAGWQQVSPNGFGNAQNDVVCTLTSFGGQLYAATHNANNQGAGIWRTSGGSTWTQVMAGGFGDVNNVGIDHLFEFNGQLYAGTWVEAGTGGEVWRSNNGSNWTRVVSQGFGDTTNGEVFRFTAFNNMLYASTWSYTDTHGAEIWRTSTGNAGEWVQVVANGFNNDANNAAVLSFQSFDGYLYAGTWNSATGGEIWRTNNGTTWTQVNTDGFGSSNNRGISALAVFNGALYASTVGKAGSAGVSVWRCQTCDGSDWTQVVANGFGDVATRLSSALEVFNGHLYLVVGNSSTGMQVWRSSTGENGTWEQVGSGGLGDATNTQPYWDNSVTVFNQRLYIGTTNWNKGGAVWASLYDLFLPLVLK